MSEAANALRDYWLLMPDCYKAPYTKIGPGQLINRMSAERREKFGSLTSTELEGERIDSIWFVSGPKRKGRWAKSVDLVPSNGPKRRGRWTA